MNYRPEIDGLRAIAVLGVVIFHAKLSLFGHAILPAGFLGVDIFFVISGYLISRILLGNLKEGTFSLKDFYVRRARRILPALLLVMLVTIPFAWVFLIPHQYESYAQSILATLAFGSNILFWQEAGYFDEPSHLKPLLHTWTLGVEEQYYIIFPIALFIGWTFLRKYISLVLFLTAIASFAIVLWAQETYLTASFYLLPTRVWEFFIGALIAKRELEKGRITPSTLSNAISFAGLAMIISSLTLFDKTVLHPGFLTLLPVIGSGLIILFGHKDNSVCKVMSSKPVVGIGLISYSFYLWHQPLFAFANAYSIDSLAQWQKAGLIVGGIFLSYLSWKFVERPFRHNETMAWSRFVKISGACFIILVGFGLHGALTHGAPKRIEGMPPLAQNLENYSKGYEVGETNCYLNPCVLGAEHVEPNLIIKGNSHAGIFAQGLQERLSEKTQSVQILANGDAHIGDNIFPEYYGGYKRWNKLIEEHNALVRDEKFEYVILSSRMTHALYGTGFDNGEGGVENLPSDEWQPLTPEQTKTVMNLFKSGIEDLLKRKKKVVLIYPIPEAGWSVPETLIKKFRRGDWAPLSTSYDLYKKRNTETIKMLDGFGERENLIRVYPDKIFCDTLVPERCTTHSDREIFYFDSDHLTKKGADLILDEIFTKMEQKWGF